MKKLLFIGLVLFASCRNMNADYAERKAGVNQVCNKCTFVLSEGSYYAVDTCKQPNLIYRVVFKPGGVWFKASDVDHLIRIN